MIEFMGIFWSQFKNVVIYYISLHFPVLTLKLKYYSKYYGFDISLINKYSFSKEQ